MKKCDLLHESISTQQTSDSNILFIHKIHIELLMSVFS